MRWLPVITGGALVAAAPLLWILEAPEATPYASALAGLALLLLGWPQRVHAPAPPDVSSWLRLARDFHLRGAVVAPSGQMFLPAQEGTPPPLDDDRSLHDGSDGYAPGLALASPLIGHLAAWRAADPQRLRDLATLEEDLNALATWTSWMRNVRVHGEPGGVRLRWEPLDVRGGAAASGLAMGLPAAMPPSGTEPWPAGQVAVAWLVALATAQAAARTVRLRPTYVGTATPGGSGTVPGAVAEAAPGAALETASGAARGAASGAVGVAAVGVAAGASPVVPVHEAVLEWVG